MENYIQADEREMAMITHKLKKFFKKAKENSKRKNLNKYRKTATGNS